jgi:hypothetical protein
MWSLKKSERRSRIWRGVVELLDVESKSLPPPFNRIFFLTFFGI